MPKVLSDFSSRGRGIRPASAFGLASTRRRIKPTRIKTVPMRKRPLASGMRVRRLKIIVMAKRGAITHPKTSSM